MCAVPEEAIWSGSAFQSAGGSADQLIVNESAVRRGEGPVFLEAHVSKKLREHQQEGLRFMCLVSSRPCSRGPKAAKVRCHRAEQGLYPGGHHGLGQVAPSDRLAVDRALEQLAPQGGPDSTLKATCCTTRGSEMRQVIIVCPSSLCGNWKAEAPFVLLFRVRCRGEEVAWGQAA